MSKQSIFCAAPVQKYGDHGKTVKAAGGLRIPLILSALMSFASVSTDVYLPAMPELTSDLHADVGSSELTLSTFLIGFSLGQLVWGPIGDRQGRRLPTALGVALFILGSIGCALSGTIFQMMGWRVVQALGACVGPVLARAMVRDLYAGSQSARMMSTLILIMGVAPLVGPLLGGQILAVWSWRGIFWVLVGIGALILAVLRFLPETLPPAHRVTEPMRHVFKGYLELVRDPKLLGFAVAGGFFYAGAYAFIAGTPFVYIDYYHVPPQLYGFLFGVNILGIMAANFLNARLVMRMNGEQLYRLGAWVVALASVVLILDARFGWGGLPGLAIPIFFFMSMNGFIVANSVAGALAAFPHRAGTASSLVGAMHYGSGILSAALVGWFANGTPWPMACIMGLAGFGCLAAALAPSYLSRIGH